MFLPCIQRRFQRVCPCPVRHDQSIPAPLLSENIIQEEATHIRMDAVDQIIARHDGPRVRLLYSNFERFKVYFSKSSISTIMVRRIVLE